MRRILLLCLSLTTLALWSTGCESEREKEEDLSPLSITVGPTNPTVEVGQSVQLAVTGLFPDDSTDDVTDLATFTTGSNEVASVSADGLITGLRVGTSVITASYDFRSDTTMVTVVPTSGGVTFVEVEPNDDITSEANDIGSAATFEGTCQDIDDPVDYYQATVTSGTFSVSLTWVEGVTAAADADLDLALYDADLLVLGTGDIATPPGDSPAEQSADLAPGTVYIEVYCYLATEPTPYVGTVTRP